MERERTFDRAVKEKVMAYSKLMRSVYLWMTFALIMTGLVSMYVASDYTITRAVMENKILFFGIIIAEVGLVMYLSARINSLKFSTAALMFALYAILNGVTLSIFFIAYTEESLASTFFITAGTFGAMALIGSFTKTDLTSMGKILMMALIGLIIATLVNLFMKSTMLYWITTYVGVLIFVGLTAYDAQKIKHMLQQHGDQLNDETQKIALMGSLKLYLDFINLFIFMLRIFGKRN